MTRDDYIHQVEAVLSEHTARAASRLGAALAHVPPKAQKAEIEIFVDQDGEGFLDVRVNIERASRGHRLRRWAAPRFMTSSIPISARRYRWLALLGMTFTIQLAIMVVMGFIASRHIGFSDWKILWLVALFCLPAAWSAISHLALQKSR